jgi:16S rRNA processing protein RimM
MAARDPAGRAAAPPGEAKARVVVARIGAAHGVRGEVRVKPLTADPMAIRTYGPLEASDGRRFDVEAARPAAGSSPDMLVVRFKGVGTREAAEALKGLELSVPRERLPQAGEDEFYHADLIGLAATTTSGDAFGTIVAMHNFGAGDLIEVAPPAGQTVFLPFTRAAVPVIDVASGRVVIVPPAGLLEDEAGEE